MSIDELQIQNPLMKKLVQLSIKYNADIASMSMAEAKRVLSKEDWFSLEQFMKHGGRDERTQSLH